MIKFFKQIDKQFFVMIINALVNIILSVAKIVVGVLFNSQLLIADGVHSASDLVTDAFYTLGLHLSQKPKDEEHPFGHSNLEYASSIAASVFIFFIVYELIADFISTINVPVQSVSFFVLAVSFMTFVVKIFLSIYVLYQAKVLDSHSLENSGIESKADAYSTIIVIAGLLVTYFGLEFNIPWLVYAEKVATLVVIGMLTRASWIILANSLRGIAGSHATVDVKEKYLKMIEDSIADKEYNVSLDDLIVVKHGINYELVLKIIFTKEKTLKIAADEIENLKATLLADKYVKKVDIAFDAA